MKRLILAFLLLIPGLAKAQFFPYTATFTPTATNTPLSSCTPGTPCPNQFTPTPTKTSTPNYTGGLALENTQQKVLTQVAKIAGGIPVVLTSTPTNTPTGSATPTPTNTPTITNTPTNTPTFTPWIPLTSNYSVASPTPNIVATPISGQGSGLIIDGIVNSGTSQDIAIVYRNGTAVANIPLAPGGGMAHPRFFPDTNGNATWGFGSPITASVTFYYNYRLWIAPVGTPPPLPLR